MVVIDLDSSTTAAVAVMHHCCNGTTVIVMSRILPMKRRHGLRLCPPRASSKCVFGSPITEAVQAMYVFK
jgi:hypothetical protein